jgi:uncharacterized protein
MIQCFFISDLHGSFARYKALFDEIKTNKPEIVFIGGDIFSAKHQMVSDFVSNFLFKELKKLKNILDKEYPSIYLILGNDDPKSEEKSIINLEKQGLIYYVHNKYLEYKGYKIYGYAYVPPTPFRFKDWEKYDIINQIDKRCFPLEEGIRTVEISIEELYSSSIDKDLAKLFGEDSQELTIVLFHSPPFNTNLDCLWNGEHAGSMAIRKFIETKQPYITLHGHIHESTQVSEKWLQKIGDTLSFNASHDGKELSIIKFDLDNPGNAIRELK